MVSGSACTPLWAPKFNAKEWREPLLEPFPPSPRRIFCGYDMYVICDVITLQLQKQMGLKERI